MKKSLTILCLSLTVWLIIGSIDFAYAKESKKEVSIPTWAAPFGTPNYRISHALEDLAKKNHPWLRLPARETKGFVWNLKQLSLHPESWDKVILQSGTNMTWLAGKPLPPFSKRFTGLKFMANWVIGGLCLATFDPDIKSINDLVGKRLALGLRAQNNYGYFPHMIIDKGWGVADKIKISWIGPGPGKTALLDGIVDATIASIAPVIGLGGKVVKALPRAPVVELISSGRRLYFIGFGKEQIEKTVGTTGAQGVFHITMPAGLVKYMDKDVVEYGCDVGFWVHESFPEDIAYEFTKFYWENCHRIKEYGAFGENTTREMAISLIPRRHYHPGALRFYKEVGVAIID